MRRIYLVGLILGCSAAMSFAQPPATQPSPEQRTTGERGVRPERTDRPERGERDRRWGGRTWMPGQDDLPRLEAFMAANAPRRWALYEKLPDGEGKNSVLRRVWGQYLFLENIKTDDPELYEWKVRQIQLEDERWDLLTRYRDSGDEVERKEIEQQLRQSIKSSIDISLKERKRRIERAEKSLQEARKRLSDDEANPSAMIDEQLQRELDRAADPDNKDAGLAPGGINPGDGPPMPGENPRRFERRGRDEAEPVRPREDRPL